MPFPKPLSGTSWGAGKEHTTAEEKPPANTKDIPRSAAGIVNDSGEIVDDSGKAIGRISDPKDPGQLIGNTVTGAGDIVDDSGNVLGRALLTQGESEYTTNNNGGDKTDGGGWNLIGKGKSAYQTASNLQQPVSQAGHLISRMRKPSEDEISSSNQNETESEKPLKEGQEEDDSQEVVKDAEDKVPGKDITEKDRPIDLEDKEGDTKDTLEETAMKQKDDLQQVPPEPTEDKPTDDLDTKDVEDAAKDKAGDVTSAGEKGKEDVAADGDEIKETGEETKTGVDDKLKEQDLQEGDFPKEGEELKEGEIPKEGEELKEGEIPKEGEELKEGEIPKEGEELKEGEIPKEGEELKEGEIPKEGEELKEGEIPKEGEELKEGEIPKEGEELKEDLEQEKPLDFSILKGTRVNKTGNLVNNKGDIIGRLVEGDAKKLLGKRSDEEGNIWDDAGKKVGKAEPLPDAEREDLKDFAPFENFPDATVEADGRVLSEGKQVGVVVEGDPKRLKGSKVDEDGDILDRRGNVVGKAEAWDEPEAEAEVAKDVSALAGKRVNKAGNVVDSSGTIFGRVVEGNVSALVGRMCDKDGNVRSESGDIIGRAELVNEGEREGLKEGPFAELSGCTVAKDGTIVTPSGDVVGRLVSGDPKTLFGRAVDEDGDVIDRNGNVLAKAERWEKPEVEKKKSPFEGRKVNREGNVLDEDGNVFAKLISGDPTICAGKEIDEDGDVINSKGNTIGNVALLEDIPPEEVESAEDKEKRESAEKDRKLAEQLAGCIEQTLDKIRPICKMIEDKIAKAERTPKEELDEEALVREVKPLIEEGGKILTETNGTIRGLDPDGRIQRNAKHKSGTKEASPEEYHLADVLKELTGTVTQTIDNAKRKIEGMPHAKKELNPLWGLLSEPLFQILAAVGLLLNGVLGLVGKLLSGLGLGGLIDGLLGSLGLNKLLDGLGLGSAVGALTGRDEKKKKKSGGGLLGLGG